MYGFEVGGLKGILCHRWEFQSVMFVTFCNNAGCAMRQILAKIGSQLLKIGVIYLFILICGSRVTKDEYC